MKVRNVARKFGSKIALAAVVPMALATQAAHAALDAGVTTAVSDTKGDLSTAGGLVIGVVVAIFGVKKLIGMFSGR